MPRIIQIYGPREPALPSLPRQAMNLGAATARFAAQVLSGRPVLVPEEVRSAREAACRACPHFRASDNRCALCGCCTGRWILDKLKYATECCPDNPPRWERLKAEC